MSTTLNGKDPSEDWSKGKAKSKSHMARSKAASCPEAASNSSAVSKLRAELPNNSNTQHVAEDSSCSALNNATWRSRRWPRKEPKEAENSMGHKWRELRGKYYPMPSV